MGFGHSEDLSAWIAQPQTSENETLPASVWASAQACGEVQCQNLKGPGLRKKAFQIHTASLARLVIVLGFLVDEFPDRDHRKQQFTDNE